MMTQHRRLTAATFRLEPELLDGLDRVKGRDGMPHSEQVRRALRQWLQSRKALRAPKRRAA
jgi:hypothetical protein